MKLNYKLTKNFLLATTLLLILWKGDDFWGILLKNFVGCFVIGSHLFSQFYKLLALSVLHCNPLLVQCTNLFKRICLVYAKKCFRIHLSVLFISFFTSVRLKFN